MIRRNSDYAWDTLLAAGRPRGGEPQPIGAVLAELLPLVGLVLPATDGVNTASPCVAAVEAA